MTFQDIFKSGFLDNVTSITLIDIALGIFLSFTIGLFIFYIYKKTYYGMMYSASFGTTLIALTMITTIVILAVTSNVVLSLGMVGALSIVRFRAAIKEPLDIAFLFWSIAAGIVLAAGMIPLAVFGSLFIGIILMIFSNFKSYDNPYMLVIHCKDQKTENIIKDILDINVKKFTIKSKSIENENIELNFHVRLKNEDTSFINTLSSTLGVSNVVLVSYNGDYMG